MYLRGKGYAKWDLEVGWWVCECGQDLPGVWPEETTVVACEQCGALYKYGHWPLNRGPGDKGRSEFQPKRISGKGGKGPP